MTQYYWSEQDFNWCVSKAHDVAGKASVLRGAASHGKKLYVFFSTINIWNAVRFTKYEGDQTKYSWQSVKPTTLSELYSDVPMDRFDLRSIGYDFVGMTYYEMEKKTCQ